MTILLRHYMVLQMLHALRHPAFQISLFSLVGTVPKKLALRRPSDIASRFLSLAEVHGYRSRLRSRSRVEAMCHVCKLRPPLPFVAQQLPGGVRCLRRCWSSGHACRRRFCCRPQLLPSERAQIGRRCAIPPTRGHKGNRAASSWRIERCCRQGLCVAVMAVRSISAAVINQIGELVVGNARMVGRTQRQVFVFAAKEVKLGPRLL